MADLDKQPAVIVENLHKSFKLPHEQHNGIKQMLVNRFKGKKGYEMQHVLKGISFEIKKGEFFGIVGRNGSGKSTLLKLLASIYTPDRGLIKINGSLTPFIELGVGFNPELTGRENVFLNGALIGFSRKEMESMYDSIVKFAELEKFMDQKLKNYSSGMQVRLAFSIAIKANSDILVLDEVLAVGDASFQQKCFDYFDNLKANNKTIILVTHDMEAVKQFCDRAIFIKDGNIKTIGVPSEVALEYEKENYSSTTDEQADGPDRHVTLELKTQNGDAIKALRYKQGVVAEISWDRIKQPVGIVGLVIYKGVEAVFATNTIGQKVNLSKKHISIEMPLELGAGRYKVAAAIFGSKRTKVIDVSKHQSLLIVDHPKVGANGEEWQGVTYVNNKWR